MNDPRLHFKKPLLTSPFHARTSALNKLNSWGPWGGYTTVLAYDDESMEYAAIRNQASVYDLSPMVKYTTPSCSQSAASPTRLDWDLKKLASF